MHEVYSLTTRPEDLAQHPARNHAADSLASLLHIPQLSSVNSGLAPIVGRVLRLRLRLPAHDPHYVAQALTRATVAYLEEDAEYYAAIPGFQGLYGTGETEVEAIQDLRGALEAWLQVRRARGLPIPDVE